MEKEKRTELVKKLHEAQKVAEDIMSEIDNLDNESEIKRLSKYLNKYYFQTPFEDNDINAVYVYGLDKERKQLKALRLHCFGPNEVYFSIQYEQYFDPEKWNEEGSFIEISKEKYYEYFSKIQSIISSCLNNDK